MMIKVGILGYGTVGKGVVHLIEERCSNIEIKHILVRSKEECLDDRFTVDFDVLLEDIDVLMEMIVGDSPAYETIVRALNKGVHVITSNKVTVAAHLQEYIDLATKNHVQFRFEASVGGGIPWIESCIKAKRVDQIHSIKGILNGTTNYILDRMTKEKIDFDVCLQEAKRLGYAEADPSADIDGFDVQRKIMISSSLAYESIIPFEEYDCISLRKIKLVDLEFFSKKGYTIKYIGFSKTKGNQMYGSVEPVLMRNDSLFASVDKNNNMIELYGDSIGYLQFVGQGAGQLPTANAMIQDLLDIVEHKANKIKFDMKLNMDKTMCKFTYVFCANQYQFNDEIIENKIEVDGRRIATSKPITPEERNEYLNCIMQLDKTCVCLRKEED